MATFWNCSCSMIPSSHRFSQDREVKIVILLLLLQRDLLWHSTSFLDPCQMSECLEREHFILCHKQNNTGINEQLRESLQSSHLENIVMRSSKLQYQLPKVGQFSQHVYVSLKWLPKEETMGFCYYLLFTKVLWSFTIHMTTHRKKKILETISRFLFPLLFKETNVKNSIALACRHLSSRQLQLKRITAAI